MARVSFCTTVISLAGAHSSGPSVVRVLQNHTYTFGSME